MTLQQLLAAKNSTEFQALADDSVIRVYARIIEAALRGKGVRLSVDDTQAILYADDAVIATLWNFLP